MKKLIVCLGYDLQPDNSIHPILENRLKDAIELCNKNKNSILLLMGASSYRNFEEHAVSQASVMRDYLIKNFGDILKDIKILTEENTTSTVEQLCYLKKFIKTENINYSDLVIISSKFFGDRVKLYTKYILGATEDIVFVESLVPSEMIEHFQKIEKGKLKKVQDWLGDHVIGDDKTILAEQKAFQNKVKEFKLNHPIS